MRAILIDIEGTITSLSFVQEVLFPYARKHMKAFLHRKKNLPEVKKAILEISKYGDGDIEKVAEILDRWMAEDSKITSLKQLQGLLWEEGYQKGDFKTPIYDEV